MRPKEFYINSHYIVQILIFILVAIVGFSPGAVGVLSGNRPNPHLSNHVHAFIMLLWMALLLVQVSLNKLSKNHLHKKVGYLSVFLAAALVVSLVVVSKYSLMEGVGTGSMEVRSNIFFMQCYSIALFTGLYIWAYRSRLYDIEAHKRVMVMATLVLLHAAIGRMSWLPFYDVPNSVNSVHIYNMALILPSLVYDFLVLGRIHRVHIIGLSAFASCIIMTAIAWGQPWWLDMVYVMVGHSNPS